MSLYKVARLPRLTTSCCRCKIHTTFLEVHVLCRGRVIITRSRVQYNEQLQLTVSEPFGDESEPGGPRMQHMFVRRQAHVPGVHVGLFPAENTATM